MRVVRSHIRPLSAMEDLAAANVGGKAARLGEMIQLALPVPAGFAIDVAAFDKFCAANDIRIPKVPSNGLAERIRAGVLPAALLQELMASLEALPAERYAVRSSAVAEDGKAFSMAGQFDSHLNVPRGDVPERVKACWAAMFGLPVVAYAEKGRLPSAQRMGVIVQRQIDPTHAGVLFTLDPVTRSADHFVVEWVEGLGDQLVSGAVTPLRIHLARRCPVVPDEVPEGLRRALQQLAEYALVVERHFGCPVDIEWASDGSQVFLLQARPVTVATRRNVVAWTNTNMAENFPQPVTPFAWSIVDAFYTEYVRNLARMLGIRDPELAKQVSPVNRLTGVQGARVYYNIGSWYTLLRTYFPTISRVLERYLDHYIGQHVPIDLDRHDDALPQRSAVSPLAQITCALRLAYYVIRGRHYLDRFERMFADFRRALRSPRNEEQSLVGMVGKLDSVLGDFVERHWYHQCIADVAVLIFPGLLDGLIARWVPRQFGNPDQVAARLLQHIDVRSTDSACLIRQLARAIESREALQTLLDAGDDAALEVALPADAREVFMEFIERFGGRCFHESMIVSPTFEERHDLFWQLVRKYQRSAPRCDGSEAQTAREGDTERILDALPPGRRQVFSFVLGQAKRAIALREQGRMVQSLLFGETRRLALALGDRLVALGHLPVVEDVFYLSLAELRSLGHGKFLLPETLPGLIAMRREALGVRGLSEPPEFFLLEDGRYFGEPPLRRVSPNGKALRGVTASGGVAEGTARVILDPVRDNTLEAGDVLVARSTDPGWTPLFLIAGALILERGGMLSHGAIVAREFGIPAVVGVDGATSRIATGVRVRVDADAGLVMVLDGKEDAVDDAAHG